MDQLKDVILSTLAEIQESVPPEPQVQKEQPVTKKEDLPSPEKTQIQKSLNNTTDTQEQKSFFEQVRSKQQPKNSPYSKESELLFLQSLRERMLVLFEGFQAPNNVSLEAKVDLTLNFLEYVLSTIDTRIENIKGK